MKHVLFLLLALAGCASAPPDAARIETLAELGEARVVRIDGQPVMAGARVHVPAGRRVLGVHCGFNTGIMIGDAQSVEREIVVDVAPGGRYRIEARMQPEPCSLSLAQDR
jgi:hypothetical protein